MYRFRYAPQGHGNGANVGLGRNFGVEVIGPLSVLTLSRQTMKDSTRRTFLQGLGSFGALALLHCAGSSTTSSASSSSGGSSSGDGTDGGSSSGSSGSDGGVAGETTVTATALATGSGAFLTSKDYGNPFASGAGATCTAYKSATKGPCHSNTFNRKDVSDGLVGVPTRFEFLVVDASCNPVPNAIVEIWYASPAGTYSRAAEAIDTGSAYTGSASDLNVGFCTGNNAEAVASNWLRGFQTSDANGRVTIDGIFPGWYAGRTTHVHLIVTANGHTTVTSQVAFDETLTTAIYTKHGSYASRGDKDTKNATDNVFAQGVSAADATMSFAQQEDGALVCWKAITLA